jgi:hypothetical protein
MATTGVAAEASNWSRRLPPGTIPRRPSAGASLAPRTGKGGPAGIGFHSWTGMVGWLPIMSPSQKWISVIGEVASGPGVGQSNNSSRAGRARIVRQKRYYKPADH